MALGDLVKLCKQRICLAQLAEVGDGRQGQFDLRVDQLLAAGDLRQVQNGVDDGVPPMWVIMAAGLILPEVIISMASFMSLVLPPEVPTTWV